MKKKKVYPEPEFKSALDFLVADIEQAMSEVMAKPSELVQAVSIIIEGLQWSDQDVDRWQQASESLSNAYQSLREEGL